MGQRRPRYRGRAALAAAALVLAAAGCTVDPVTTSSSSSADTPGFDTPVRIAMITHGDAGGFWSVVRRGAEEAAEQLNVVLDYQGSAGDAKVQSQMIGAALLAGAQGLAVSAPDVGAIKTDIERAVASGIPVITLNSGAELAKQDIGVITHVGQSEAIAGVGAGEQLLKAGDKKILCILHEQNNIGLQERCDGAARAMTKGGGSLAKVQVTGKSDPGSTAREVGAAIAANSPDAVLALDPDIAIAAIKETTDAEVDLATFDLSPDVIEAVQDGRILFAVDQQPYLQGYLPVDFLSLAVRNGNEVGAGDIVLTGPSFVTKDNAAQVASLAQQGTR